MDRGAPQRRPPASDAPGAAGVGARNADAAADDTLLAGLRAGDDAAFETLVRQHGGRMLAVARRLLGDEAEAADAVQDALLSVSRSIGGFQGGSRLSTWLHRVVVNAALMRLRTRRRRHEESIEDLLPLFREDGHQARPAEPWAPVEDRLVTEETRALVRASIRRLPETYRVVLMLRDIEELDTQDVATILGITPNAVKIRLHRARQALRTLLDPHLRGERP